MKCNICPRKCNVDRSKVCGYCGAKSLKVAKVMLHHWEEPVISGTNGSGAIFFSHCNMKCIFCQNYQISHRGKGKEISINDLVQIFKDLEQKGAHNINLVTPSHYTAEIISALKIYKPCIPVVWNSSGFESAETIAKLKGLVDVYLVDLKYCSPELSAVYSAAPNYFEEATLAIAQMRKNQPIDVIENGLMKKGIIIRHMILPSHVKDSLAVLDWIAENLGTDTFISLMNQYTPCFKACAPVDRKLDPLEYKIVVSHAIKLGFKNGFVQDKESATTQFIPDFDE